MKIEEKALKTGEKNENFVKKIEKTNSFEEDMDALEERLYQEKFKILPINEKIPKNLSKSPQKNDEIREFHNIQFLNIDIYEKYRKEGF